MIDKVMIKKARLVFFICICICLVPFLANGYDASADSPEMNIEDLMNVPVYGASRFGQQINEAPGSVSIVTSEEIKKYGYRTLADILRSLRGFYVTYDRNYAYAGIRGFLRTGDWNSRILILLDGNRINENVYGSANIETGFIIDIDLIDRVEVIRGSNFSLYGNNAMFAVINVITKKGRDLGSPEISGEVGSFDTYKGRFSYGNSFRNGMELVLSSSLYDSKGQDLFFKKFDTPSMNNGVAEDCDYDRNYSFFSKLSYRDFTFEGAYVERTKGIPTASYETDFNDPRNRSVDEYGILSVKYEHIFANSLTLLARLFYGTFEVHGDYIYEGIVNKDLGEGEWWGAEVLLNKTVMERHNITVGGEYDINIKQNQKNYDKDPFYLYTDDKRRSDNWSLFIQDEFRIFKDFILNAGIRYDYFSSSGETTNPRVALIYSPFKKTTLKFLYGTAFRAPNAYELYSNDGMSLKPNPDLRSETMRNYEFIAEQSIGDHLWGSIGWFFYRVKNLISQEIDLYDELGRLEYRNVGQVNGKGLEFEIDGKWDNGLRGRISYTFQKVEYDSTGEPLINSPKHLAKFNLIAPLLNDKLFAGTEVQYTSKRKTLSGRWTDGFFVTNLTLFSQRLLKGLEVSASVYNLFDKKYSDPGGEEHLAEERPSLYVIEQDGRTFRVKVTYAF